MDVTHLDLDADELRSIVERAQLNDDDRSKLLVAVDTLVVVTQALRQSRVSIARLKKLVFGPRTEKRKPKGQQPSKPAGTKDGEKASSTSSNTGDSSGDEKPPRKGHGRNPASAYTGASCVSIPHESLTAGCQCPGCQRGKLRPFKPLIIMRLYGQAPVQATKHEAGRVRCDTCQEIFTAKLPDDIGKEKYQASAIATIGTMKYCTGMPFNRLARLQDSLGVPLPPSTQWQLVNEGEKKLAPAFNELKHQASNGTVLHNDDTPAKILDLKREMLEQHDGDERTGRQRTGIFTTGIVSVLPSKQHVALFFTGLNHAGENLGDVLDDRDRGLGPPIHMSDGLSANTPKTDLDVIVAKCLVHARRNFVDIEVDFPEECAHLIEQLRLVYVNDAKAKARQLSDDERLKWHQKRSEPIMTALKDWFDDLLDNKKVEPNSPLGAALKYLRKHWKALTLFLSVAGAPLDNNVCERALKKAILHRKNALYFRSLRGARVADVFMSLGYSAVLAKANPVAYLTALLEHHEEVARDPAAWMPWNYTTALDYLASAA